MSPTRAKSNAGSCAADSLAMAISITAAAAAIERHAMVRPPDLRQNDGDQQAVTGEAYGRARTSARWASFGYADFRTALSTSVLPSDQIAPGTLWLAAMTSSNDFSIQLQSSSVITSGGSSLMVWLPWPETCVRIL